MIPQIERHLKQILRTGVSVLVAGVLAWSVPSAAEGTETELTWEFKQALFQPVEDWIEELEDAKDDDGYKYIRGAMSRTPRKVDDETYELGMHLNTAENDAQVTERYKLTLKKDGKNWTIAEKQVLDKYVGLFRPNGSKCYPFEKFAFEKEGLTLSATGGTLCETFFKGGISAFGLNADNMAHSYSPPDHAAQIPVGRDYKAMHRYMKEEHMKELYFKPAAFLFECDVTTCEEILSSSFEGLERIAPDERDAVHFSRDDEAISPWARDLVREMLNDRKEYPLGEFRVLDEPGRSRVFVFVSRDLEMDSGVFLARDTWSGWEVQVGVAPKRYDIPNQLIGPVFGYYSQETLGQSDLYEIERRPDGLSRWYEVESIRGRVYLGLDDPEMLRGDVEFGLKLRQDVEELPFFIASNRTQGALGGTRVADLYVNSVEVGGKELTWVRTGPTSGRIILPEEMKAGSRLDLRMDFSTRAIIKYNHSYSYVNRSGWLPFVRFGDMIDVFEMTMHSPSQYTIYGDGHMVDESVEGDVRTSSWKAEFPVNFPTIIFGKYRTDQAEFNALKADGKTVIPVRVSVDEVSLSSADWDIREGTLRPIAEQAANAINLYTAISAVEYPFGELSLVNDPTGFLYGQAPGAIIYLGSGVFMSEAKLIPALGDATSTARFKRSVVAHEVGHKWWGATVSHANNRHRWYRESLAEYFSALYLEFAYGYKDYLDQVEGWRRNLFETNLRANVQNAQSLFAGEWGGGTAKDARTAAVYDKGPYAFHMLRETFRDPTIEERGPEGADRRFFTFLKLFTRELAKKREVVTLDIQRAAESGLGGVDQDGNRVNVDLSWFFDQWIRGTGMPQYDFSYDVRRAEDGSYIVSGLIKQRIVIGSGKNLHTLDGQVYRGIIYVTAKAKGGPVRQRVIINGPQTQFQFKVAKKPYEVVLNEDGEMLALDVVTN